MDLNLDVRIDHMIIQHTRYGFFSGALRDVTHAVLQFVAH
jgi:hypothetical protein